MNAIVYATVHNKTASIVNQLDWPKLNVAQNPSLANYQNLIIICPTYGDEELPIVMEDYLLSLDCIKNFAVCELGNYYGYDDYTFGAARIIRGILLNKGWHEFYPSGSVDTLPKIIWQDLWTWYNNAKSAI